MGAHPQQRRLHTVLGEGMQGWERAPVQNAIGDQQGHNMLIKDSFNLFRA